MIIGGHDHSPHMSMHHHTLILKCGQDLDYLGILDMHLELSPLTDGYVYILCMQMDHQYTMYAYSYTDAL